MVQCPLQGPVREIEELRDLVNTISAKREKTDAAAQRPENSAERGAEDSGDVDDVSKGQFDQEIVQPRRGVSVGPLRRLFLTCD